MALTDNGCVFGWGDNSEGQLGNATQNDCDEPILIDGLRDVFITDFCCGLKHSLVLTRNGDVYAFGSNRFGQCGTGCGVKYQTVAVKLQISSVTAISCGDHHSIALTTSGRVLVWGMNDFGQLGTEDTSEQWIPKQLSVVPPIQQIVCGKSFTLMLSRDNCIYFCGKIENAFLVSNPTKISGSTKFNKISASISSDLCIALAENNICYVFGKCGESMRNELMQTEFDSIDEVFAVYEQITCKTIATIPRNYNRNFIEIVELGSGGFGTVFKCECKADHKMYAIKKVNFQSEKREAVYKELKFLSQLDSKFVVKCYDSWVEQSNHDMNRYDNRDLESISSDNSSYSPNFHYVLMSNPNINRYVLYIQMELCSLTLRDVIEIISKQCLTNHSTLSLIGYYISYELFIEILECVQYLHQQSPPIIHRDLKPANILINFHNNNRFVKLCDFGLSTFHEFADQSHTGGHVGTVRYIAPEILSASFNAQEGKPKAKYTTKADIYSLGIILQELFIFDNRVTLQGFLPFLVPKMNKIKARLLELQSRLEPPENRPECDAMLKEFDLLRLSVNEIESDKSFMRIIANATNSYSIDTEFIKFFIHNKYNFK